MKKIKANKKGFTLLEVMLATVILLISSLMMFQGFMSTITFSTNTALYAKAGGANTQSAYAKVVEKRGVKDIGGSATKMEVAGSGYDFTIFVNTWRYAGGTAGFSAYGYSEPVSAVSTSRGVVTYKQTMNKQCPNDPTHAVARDANDGTAYRYYCTVCNGPYI